MNKITAVLGVLTVGGALSICDPCGPGGRAASGDNQWLVSVANATPLTGSRSANEKRGSGDSLLPAAGRKTAILNVEGMTCGGCVLGVRKVLSRLAGVSKAEVSYEKRRAVVTYDPAVVTTTQMIAAIKTLGYTATVVASPEGSGT
ncbi:MAG: metal-binding (seleno)protein [Gemmatimonadaceae bacterium]